MTPKTEYTIFPKCIWEKKKSPSLLCLGGSKRVVWNWCHHLIHSLRSVTLPYVTSVIHGPWFIFFIYPLVSPAPHTTASIKKSLKYLLIEWMNFIKKNWLSKALHLVYLFQILFTLPYRDHPTWSIHVGVEGLKNLDPFNRTLSPKGFWHLQMKFSSQLRVRNKSRKMCWWLILTTSPPTNSACFPRVSWEWPPKQTTSWMIGSECVTVRAIKPCPLPYSFKSLARTCFPHIVW